MPGTHSAYLKPPRPWKNIKDESVLPKSSIRPVPVEDFTPPIVVESRDWLMEDDYDAENVEQPHKTERPS